MREFASPSARAAALSRPVKMLYTAFCAFTALGLLSCVGLYDGIVGFAARATPAQLYANLIAHYQQAMEPRKLLEVTHFHLFSVPLYLLVVGHLFLLSGRGARTKTLVVTAAVALTALHLAAPWLVALGGGGCRVDLPDQRSGHAARIRGPHGRARLRDVVLSALDGGSLIRERARRRWRCPPGPAWRPPRWRARSPRRPHGQPASPALAQLAQPRKCAPGIAGGGRDAHQPLAAQRRQRAHLIEQRPASSGSAPASAVLAADVHFQEHGSGRRTPAPPGQLLRHVQPIAGVDERRPAHHQLHLVRLQRPDGMPFHAGPQRLRLVPQLLRVVLAEVRLPRPYASRIRSTGLILLTAISLTDHGSRPRAPRPPTRAPCRCHPEDTSTAAPRPPPARAAASPGAEAPPRC